MKRTNDTSTIVFTNNKGGVGKTSSCTAIGSLLGLLGYKCLIVDNDFQTNTTVTFLEDGESPKKSLCDVYKLTTFTPEAVSECIMHTKYANVDLLPTTPDLQDIDMYLYSQMGKRVVQKILARGLKQIKNEYDYILIDTHPDSNLVAQNALCCSDYVLTPVQANGYSIQGLVPLVNNILAIAADEDLNPNLKFLGMFLVNAKPRTVNFKQYQQFCKETFNDDYIPVSIRQDSAIDDVATQLLPLPYLLGSKDYKASSDWKAIYDYLVFMHIINMIDDVDYVAGMIAFSILENRLLVTLNQSKISKLTIGNKRKCNIAPDVSLENLIIDANSHSEVLQQIQSIIIAAAQSDRQIRVYGPNDARSYIKISALKEDK